MKILHLTLKKKWFDMIASGEKREEYREIKMYWATRLCNGFPSVFGIDLINPDFKDFEYIIFKNGYSKTARTIRVKCMGIHVGSGKPEWGGNERCYVIRLGQIC